MKLAISNIAWNREDESSVIQVLREAKIHAVEIAPTKVWANLEHVTIRHAQEYRVYWERQGFQVVAMQALLFGRADLLLFHSKASRKAMFDYLTHVMELGATLGVKPLVFGSPQNRRLGHLSEAEGFAVAAYFFGNLARRANALGVLMCIEPNPAQYGCDFILTVADAVRLVKIVNSPAFRLHLDSSALLLNQEDIQAALGIAEPYLAHVHLSEPFLTIPGEYIETHQVISTELRKQNYTGFISIEMRTGHLPNNADAVRRAAKVATSLYGSF